MEGILGETSFREDVAKDMKIMYTKGIVNIPSTY